MHTTAILKKWHKGIEYDAVYVDGEKNRQRPYLTRAVSEWMGQIRREDQSNLRYYELTGSYCSAHQRKKRKQKKQGEENVKGNQKNIYRPDM